MNKEFVLPRSGKLMFLMVCLLLNACSSTAAGSSPLVPPEPTPITNQTPAVTTSPITLSLPEFSHVIIIMLENHEYGKVVGNTQKLPYFQGLISQYTLLTGYYAVAHPSLPNYLALIGGDTFGIQSDCFNCFISAPSLPDGIEASGRTWRNYAEDMPSPCFIGRNGKLYTQVVNPFIYFNLIRQNTVRCDQNVVPLTQLDRDLGKGYLPDFAFITPSLCNSGHSCDLGVTDNWLEGMVSKIMNSTAFDANSLIVVTFDEGSTNASCCGLGKKAGGHVATLLISPLVQSDFKDDTPYSHYSLLKTIETSWGLPLLGHAADPRTNLIVAPWKK